MTKMFKEFEVFYLKAYKTTFLMKCTRREGGKLKFAECVGSYYGKPDETKNLKIFFETWDENKDKTEFWVEEENDGKI